MDRAEGRRIDRPGGIGVCVASMTVSEIILNKPAGPGSLEPAADAEHRTIRGFHGGGSNATQVSSRADDGRHLRGERNCRTTSGKGIESGSDRDCGLVQEQGFEQEDFDREVNDREVNDREVNGGQVNGGQVFKQVFKVRREGKACSDSREWNRSTVASDATSCRFAKFICSFADSDCCPAEEIICEYAEVGFGKETCRQARNQNS